MRRIERRGIGTLHLQTKSVYTFGIYFFQKFQFFQFRTQLTLLLSSTSRNWNVPRGTLLCF